MSGTIDLDKVKTKMSRPTIVAMLVFAFVSGGQYFSFKDLPADVKTLKADVEQVKVSVARVEARLKLQGEVTAARESQ